MPSLGVSSRSMCALVLGPGCAPSSIELRRDTTGELIPAAPPPSLSFSFSLSRDEKGLSKELNRCAVVDELLLLPSVLPRAERSCLTSSSRRKETAGRREESCVSERGKKRSDVSLRGKRSRSSIVVVRGIRSSSSSSSFLACSLAALLCLLPPLEVDSPIHLLSAPLLTSSNAAFVGPHSW